MAAGCASFFFLEFHWSILHGNCEGVCYWRQVNIGWDNGLMFSGLIKLICSDTCEIWVWYQIGNQHLIILKVGKLTEWRKLTDSWALYPWNAAYFIPDFYVSANPSRLCPWPHSANWYTELWWWMTLGHWKNSLMTAKTYPQWVLMIYLHVIIEYNRS